MYDTEDYKLYQRALGILYRLSLEQTGWRGFLRRWYYGHEPLRNDAANLVRQVGYYEPRPVNTCLIADPTEGKENGT